MILSLALPGYMLCACLAATEVATDPVPFAVEVRRFSFEAADDRDFDSQPDDWSRRRGPEFPEYVEAAIDRKRGFDGGQSLKIGLDGGQGAIYSPLVPVDSAHSYVFSGRMQTERLVHDAAFLSISLLNHKRQRVQRYLSKPVTGTHRDWVQVQIGPISPDPRIRFIVIGCHVAHQERMDIRGAAWFDDLRLGNLPRMSLTTNSATSFYLPGQAIRVRMQVQGLTPGHAYRLLLKLTDSTDKVLQSSEFPLSSDEASPAPIDWDLPAQTNGIYRVRATLEQDGQQFLLNQTSFGVMDPDDSENPGEFGWSLSRGTAKMPLTALAETAAQAGINWVKVPVWSTADPSQEARAVELTRLMQQFDRHGIVVVGLLNDPPDQLTRKFAYNWVGVSKVFTLPPEVWYPTLEPVIARYSFHVRHWQLGDETDASFVGLKSLPQVLNTVKREFDRIGRDVHLGLHWDWAQRFPAAADVRQSFFSVSTDPPLPPPELAAALEGSRTGVTRWVLLTPSPLATHTPDQRAGELVRSMAAAKIGKAEGIFVADPFDPQRGLLNEDGTPTDLFLPWRTAALALRGAEYLGSLKLPNNSENAVFVRRGEVLMIIWNPESTHELTFLGDNVQLQDLNGRKTAAERVPETGQQRIPVGQTPLIVRNGYEPLVRWQMAVRFEKGRMSSEYGGHQDAILGRNPFPQGVSGVVRLQLPKDWKIEPSEWTIQLGAGEEFRLPTLLTFPPNSSLGSVNATIDFEIAADRPYKLTIHRPLEVGLGDIVLDVACRSLPDGRLEIEQQIENSTQPPEIVNFNCSLFVPGHKRQRQTVVKLGQGTDHKFYYLPNAASMQGREIWVRAEQSNGNRVLNYKLIVGE